MASETEGGQLGSESAAAAREAVLGREVRSEMRERDEVARNLMPTTVGVSRDDEYYESGHVAREVPHATTVVQAAPPSIGAFSKMAAFVVVVAASMIWWCSSIVDTIGARTLAICTLIVVLAACVHGAGIGTVEYAHSIGEQGLSGVATTTNTQECAIPFCIDSGSTCVCVPKSDMWLLSEITNHKPNISLEVASGTRLPVVAVGKINSNNTGLH